VLGELFSESAGRVIQRATKFWVNRWKSQFRGVKAASKLVVEKAAQKVTGQVSRRVVSDVEPYANALAPFQLLFRLGDQARRLKTTGTATQQLSGAATQLPDQLLISGILICNCASNWILLLLLQVTPDYARHRPHNVSCAIPQQ
jgi:hypothetical protein